MQDSSNSRPNIINVSINCVPGSNITFNTELALSIGSQSLPVNEQPPQPTPPMQPTQPMQPMQPTQHMQPTSQQSAQQSAQPTQPPQPTQPTLPPGLFGNRRVNLHNPADNSRSSLEIFSYAPTAGGTSTTPENTAEFSNQLNNVTRNLIDMFATNVNNTTNSNTTTDGLNLNELRQYTTLTIHVNPPTTADSSEPIINKCEICHDNINEHDILRVINICSHSFHQECIDSWLENNCICPYCRGDIVNNDTIPTIPATAPTIPATAPTIPATAPATASASATAPAPDPSSNSISEN
jgi:hypothetical protein